MRPDPRFIKQPKLFWANVRSISQRIGYTDRSTKRIKVPALSEMTRALNALGLSSSHVVDNHGKATELGANLEAYFEYRAKALNEVVRTELMDISRARKTFEGLRARLRPRCPLPLNKQKGEKRRVRLSLLVLSICLSKQTRRGCPVTTTPEG